MHAAHHVKRKGSTMTSHKEALAIKLKVLAVLLDDPRTDDDEWAVDLLYALESIYDLALNPNSPVIASSRANHTLVA